MTVEKKPNKTKHKRVAFYIDGFNLYYGLREKGWRRYYWLDLAQLASNLVRKGEQVSVVHYFTARVAQPGSRQKIYLEALETVPTIQIHYGKFLKKNHECPKCGNIQTRLEEKMSDVNIATNLICNAFDDDFDRAILVSADSDLLGPVSLLLRRFPDKEITVAFPPRRFSKDLQDIAKTSIHIKERHLRNSQLPGKLVKVDGYVLTRPSNWK